MSNRNVIIMADYNRHLEIYNQNILNKEFSEIYLSDSIEYPFILIALSSNESKYKLSLLKKFFVLKEGTTNLYIKLDKVIKVGKIDVTLEYMKRICSIFASNTIIYAKSVDDNCIVDSEFLLGLIKIC